MFSLFKRKKSDSEERPPAAEETVGSNEELLRKADELLPKIESAEGVAKADLLDRRGTYLLQAGATDDAISAFEESLSVERRMGDAYKGLTSLYNRKRSEAAAAGDDAAMKVYFDKLQALMQSSKDLLRGK